MVKTEQPSDKEQFKITYEDASEFNVQNTASDKMHYDKDSDCSSLCDVKQRETIVVRDASTGYPEENYVNVSLSLRRGNEGDNNLVKKSSRDDEIPCTAENSSMQAESVSRMDVKQSSVDDLGMGNASDIVQQKQQCLNKIDKKGKHSFVNVSINIGPN